MKEFLGYDLLIKEKTFPSSSNLFNHDDFAKKADERNLYLLQMFILYFLQNKGISVDVEIKHEIRKLDEREIHLFIPNLEVNELFEFENDSYSLKFITVNAKDEVMIYYKSARCENYFVQVFPLLRRGKFGLIETMEYEFEKQDAYAFLYEILHRELQWEFDQLPLHNGLSLFQELIMVLVKWNDY